MIASSPAFAELGVASNYSFLRGASHGAELVARAVELGLTAIAVADRNTLAGVVRAYAAMLKDEAIKASGLHFIVGSRLVTTDGIELLVWPQDRAAYGRLCTLLTTGNRRAPKGECHLALADIAAHAEGLWAALIPPVELPPTLTLPLKGGGDEEKSSSEKREQNPPPLRGREGWGVFTHNASVFPSALTQLKSAFADRLSLALVPYLRGQDAERFWRLAEIARAADVPLLATNDVLMHGPERRPLADVLTCIREKCTIDEAGLRLAANAERHLKSPAEMAALFRNYPDALARSVEIAAACTFSLSELKYEYPAEPVPEGMTPQEELERRTWKGADWRFPDGVPQAVKNQLAHEFKLIFERNYAPYFLTVDDVVAYARRPDVDILCQGRGSAANSAVCYCLGITEIDPVHNDLLFERFLSSERNEPPDIDVDFEHERREEVIQYIYNKYGRDRAGIAATVISYRSRGALRDIGKVMGLSGDTIAALSNNMWGSSFDGLADDNAAEMGLDPNAPRLRQTLELAKEIRGFPRHLSQHVGGFVLTRGPLHQVVPIMNAAMDDRTNVEWDKEDLDTLGILKIDVLALGMLTCLRKGFALLDKHHDIRRAADDKPWKPADVPADDVATYKMLQRADAVGVFQVESRAQMSMLPRLKPDKFYDLVIEVAIVRPGPIQGGMVHPYLRRKQKLEKVTYPSKALEKVLEKTLGVPLFQEQAMKIAIVGAGFTPAESDGLRRAMATFRRNGTIGNYEERFLTGMVKNGYTQQFAEQCFSQIKGFGDYGFPESHAASFALLAYVSAWMKCHYPAAFACALLNSQPMGFYAAAQIVADVRAHGVEVRPVDINASDWDCTLEDDEGGQNIPPILAFPLKGGRNIKPDEASFFSPSPLRGEGRGGGGVSPALRLGFRQIKGFSEADGEKLMAARSTGYTHPRDLVRRAGLKPAAVERLAESDVFLSLGLSRRAALWAAKGLGEALPPLLRLLDNSNEAAAEMPLATQGEEVVNDYKLLHLTLRQHPAGFLRDALILRKAVTAAQLAQIKDGAPVIVAGLSITRQRPGEGNIVFVTLEDETGIINVVVRIPVYEMYRRAILSSALMAVEGRMQIVGDAAKGDTPVVHVVADRCMDWSGMLSQLLPDKQPRATPLRAQSHDFR
ncbi:MAG TPA: error-prone DNA polymerase [Magnetospirillaceae bacterium]|jgi:error-prone DNA polymerase